MFEEVGLIGKGWGFLRKGGFSKGVGLAEKGWGLLERGGAFSKRWSFLKRGGACLGGGV